jgi:hypothetical protein
VRDGLEEARTLAPSNTKAILKLIETAPSELVAAEALRRLADHGTSRALAAVRSTLDDERPGVRAEAALQLARTGGERDVEAIAAVQTRAPVAARKVRFAKALIAHRFGMPARPLDVGELRFLDATKAGVTKITTRQLTSDQLGAAVAALRHSFGVQLSETGVELVCGTDRTWIVLSDSAASATPEELLKQPEVLAVGISAEEETQRWSPDWVILGTPRRDELALRVFSSSGRLQFAGTATMDESDLRFEVSPVAEENGPALAVAGTISEGELQVGVALHSARTSPGMSPTPAEG